MAAGGRMHGMLLARTLDWSATRRVLDVGGGDGTLVGSLLDHHPHLEAAVLELPEVADRVPVGPRLGAIAGDAFAHVPGGYDTYLLVDVLHDWADEAATRLLERVADAARATVAETGRDPRIVVVDGEAHTRARDDLTVRTDLLMLALTPGGREQSTVETAAVAGAAGLALAATHHLASGDVAHELRLPGDRRPG